MNHVSRVPNRSGMIAERLPEFPTLVGGVDIAGEWVDRILLGHVAVETLLVAECYVVPVFLLSPQLPIVVV